MLRMDNYSSSNEDTHSDGVKLSDSMEKSNAKYHEMENGSTDELCETRKKRIYRCANCNREVEDVLILSCKHLMCLTCSSIQLQEKYDAFVKAYSGLRNTEKREANYKIGDCFADSSRVTEKANDDKVEEILKKEKLGYITCHMCNIKNKLTLDTIELLTKVGLFSSDVLNVHTFHSNIVCNNDGNKNKKEGINEEHLKEMGKQLNDVLHCHTAHDDTLKSEKLKRLLLSSSKYKYLDEHIDDLSRYSYLCNICSFNEAVIYCNDCVEYLCRQCCESIHEMERINKIGYKNEKNHNYYEIEKEGINLKKIVKSPKKFMNITRDDIEILNKTDDESFDDEGFDEKKKYKVYDDEDYSDFDNYDEKHFYERKKMLIQKDEKKKKKVNISNKLNDLVENMKNGSSYGSDNSSVGGTIGSIIDTGEKFKRNKKKSKNRRSLIRERGTNTSSGRSISGGQRGKKTNRKGKLLRSGEKVIHEDEVKNESICLLSNESKPRVDVSSSASSLPSNDDSGREICINNITNRDTQSNRVNGDMNESANGYVIGGVQRGINNLLTNDVINTKNFTTIENIRCSQHYNYPIQYFCHTCNGKCFCAECAINGIHTTECNIENINTAFITVLNNYLIQWNEVINELINDLDRNFYESLEDTKHDWSSLLSESYYDLSSKISYIMNNMNKKEKEIFHQFDIYMENFKKENLDYIDLLNSKYEDIEKIINIIRDNKFEKNPIDLIKFYRNNINDIDKTIFLNNDFKPIEDLSKIRESKIFYMDLYASQIISYLRYLQTFLTSDISLSLM
ncbi:hypothetical protein POVWA1_054910 [Plasmodium ovale wallikeri]|uniref:B box-type domain-containing protein n=1 Tax=Plasmodium ovale wallikeri TaxID=864142 RepID=A0A1A8ZSV3_PLAOA|nr:hypothetical protein POVWA1_054910 [Plasmodium ovale wallikeri]